MREHNNASAQILAAGLVLGLGLLGYLLSQTVDRFKSYERTVTVKGLAEQEVPADIVIWPIQFTEASNDLGALYQSLSSNSQRIEAFLREQGIDAAAISRSIPVVTDKSAQQWGGGEQAPFRYTANQTITVYSTQVEPVRAAMNKLADLGREGIAFSPTHTEYLFTRLNELKPEMVEEATREAREVARKFAEDSDSKLGKIKRASQGQFSIGDRDTNNPHIKKVRVVSTIEYYLSD